MPGASERFAIDGDVSQAKVSSQGLNPVVEAGLEGLGVKAFKDALEGIMGRDAVGQLEEGCQPGAASPRKGNHLLPIIGISNDGTDGDDDDVEQEVSLEVLTPRVAESAKEPSDGESGHGHASSP